MLQHTIGPQILDTLVVFMKMKQSAQLKKI